MSSRWWIFRPRAKSRPSFKGQVDAVSAFEIYSFEINQRLGDNAVSWDIQNSLAFHWLLASTEKILVQSPEPLRRLLSALIKAESFARGHEEEAQNIVSRIWGFDPLFLQQSWPRTRLKVSFGQSIVTSLRTYTNWQLSKAGHQTMAQPNVLNFLYPGILDGVAPNLVTIYR